MTPRGPPGRTVFAPSHAQVCDLVAQTLPYFIMKEFVTKWSPIPPVSGEDLLGRTPVSWIDMALNQCHNSIPNGQVQQLITKVTTRTSVNCSMSPLPEESGTSIVKAYKSHDILLHPKKVVIDLFTGNEIIMSNGMYEVLFMAVFLNSTKNNNKDNTDEMKMSSAKKSTEKRQAMTQSVIAIIPSAGIFFSLKKSHVVCGVRQFEPLPIRWLKLKRRIAVNASGMIPLDVFGEGSYVDEIIQNQVYRMSIQLRMQTIPECVHPSPSTANAKPGGNSDDISITLTADQSGLQPQFSGIALQRDDVEIIHCLHIPDGMEGSTIPDYFTEGTYSSATGEVMSVSEVPKVAPFTKDMNKELYEKQKKKSQKLPFGDPGVVRGAMHQFLPEDCFVLGQRDEDNELRHYDVIVAVQQYGEDGSVTLYDETIIEVRYQMEHGLHATKSFLRDAWAMKHLPRSPNTNLEQGYRTLLGQETVIGMNAGHVQVRPRPTNSVVNRAQLKQALIHASTRSKREFPAVSKLLRDVDTNRGIPNINWGDDVIKETTHDDNTVRGDTEAFSLARDGEDRTNDDLNTMERSNAVGISNNFEITMNLTSQEVLQNGIWYSPTS